MTVARTSHLPNSRWAALVIIACVIALTPSRARAGDAAERYQESYVYEAKAKYAQALASLERVDQASKNTYAFHLRRGWLRYLSGKYEDAINSYQQAARLQPKAIEPLLGMIYPTIALRRWQDVVKTARAARAFEPHNSFATGRMAYAYFNLGQYREAEKLYSEVVTRYPADVEMRSGLAWTLLKLGKRRKARRQFRAVLAIAPRQESALLGIKACD